MVERIVDVRAPMPPAPMEPLEVRGSHSGESSRVAFYWDKRTSHRVVSDTPGELKLQFSKRAKPDLAYLRITPPPNLASFEGENTNRGYLVTIKSKDQLPLKAFLEGETLVVDISKPLPPAAVQDKPAPNPKEQGGAISLTPPPEQPAAVASPETPASAVIGGRDRVTALVPAWSDPAPRNGVVLVKAAPLANGLKLDFPFAAPAPAAVFSRGPVVWAVFAANADLKIDAASLPAGYRARTMRVRNATVLRLETPRGLSVSAEMDESSWSLKIAPSATRPQRFTKSERRNGDDGRARVETMLIGAAGIVWFEDPVIGDQLAVAVSYGPSTASPTPRDFVEASLPATAHGVAIAPKSDDVQVTLEGERVVISMFAGAQSAPEATPGDIGAGEASARPR